MQNKLNFTYSIIRVSTGDCSELRQTKLREKTPKHNTKKRTWWHVPICKYPVFQSTLSLHLLVHTQHVVLQGCSSNLTHAHVKEEFCLTWNTFLLLDFSEVQSITAPQRSTPSGLHPGFYGRGQRSVRYVYIPGSMPNPISVLNSDLFVLAAMTHIEHYRWTYICTQSLSLRHTHNSKHTFH